MAEFLFYIFAIIGLFVYLYFKLPKDDMDIGMNGDPYRYCPKEEDEQ